jgi:hypothetical protein
MIPPLQHGYRGFGARLFRLSFRLLGVDDGDGGHIDDVFDLRAML